MLWSTVRVSRRQRNLVDRLPSPVRHGPAGGVRPRRATPDHPTGVSRPASPRHRDRPRPDPPRDHSAHPAATARPRLVHGSSGGGECDTCHAFAGRTGRRVLRSARPGGERGRCVAFRCRAAPCLTSSGDGSSGARAHPRHRASDIAHMSLSSSRWETRRRPPASLFRPHGGLGRRLHPPRLDVTGGVPVRIENGPKASGGRAVLRNEFGRANRAVRIG